jgi:type IV pilus biogenesis protein PilP
MSDPKLSATPPCGIRIVLTSLCALAVGAAQAQQSSVPQASANSQPAPQVTEAEAGRGSSAVSASTAAEIQRINERMTLLQAQLNELELQARIGAKRKEIESTATTAGTPSAFASHAGVPSVQSVAGLKGRLEAVLVFPGGVTQRVKAGDVIDDRRVTKVSLNEVVLTDLQGRKAQRLAFGAAPAVRENAPVAGTGPGVFASPVMGR